MDHFLYLIFRCDFDVMKSLEEWEGSKHTPDAATARESSLFPIMGMGMGMAAGNPSMDGISTDLVLVVMIP